MSRETAQFDRRTLLRGALATAAIVPLGGTLAACGGSSPSAGGGGGSSGPKSASNPFGLAKSSSVDAVIFNGGYGYDYVKFAAEQVKKQKNFSGVTIKVDAVDTDRPAAAATLRRRQPTRPDRQLGRERHRVQRRRAAARATRRRLRHQQLRGHQDLGHALPEREGPGDVRRQVHRDELRHDGLRRLVLRRAVPAERLDPAEDLGRGGGPRRQGQGARASTSGSGARRPRRTTRRWPSTPPSRRAATRSAWRWRTSSRSAGRYRRSRASSRRSARWCRRATSSPAAPAPSSPPPRRSGATTSRRSSTRPAAGSRTR